MTRQLRQYRMERTGRVDFQRPEVTLLGVFDELCQRAAKPLTLHDGSCQSDRTDVRAAPETPCSRRSLTLPPLLRPTRGKNDTGHSRIG